jgi:hypothetical protein
MVAWAALGLASGAAIVRRLAPAFDQYLGQARNPRLVNVSAFGPR